MEYQINDRVKIEDFIEACKMGSITYGFGLLKSTVKFPDGTEYDVQDLKSICGKVVKITKLSENSKGVVYHVAWENGKTKQVGYIRPFLMAGLFITLVKCEVSDLDRATVKFKAKVLETNNRREHNKRVARKYALNKGKKT